MKFKLLAIWLVAVIVAALVLGCTSLGLQPVKGQYVYTHKPLNMEVIRVVPIWIDKNFGEADRLAIDDAIRAWNFAMNGYVQLKIVDMDFDMEPSKIVDQVNQNGWLFMKLKSDSKLIPEQKEKGYWTIGFTEKLGGHHLYLVRDRLANEDVFGVTMHEIGHLMGSDHVGDRLMRPHFNRTASQCIDYDTIKAVASYNNLPLDRLNYCMDQAPDPVKKDDKSGPVLLSCPGELGKDN